MADVIKFDEEGQLRSDENKIITISKEVTETRKESFTISSLKNQVVGIENQIESLEAQKQALIIKIEMVVASLGIEIEPVVERLIVSKVAETIPPVKR